MVGSSRCLARPGTRSGGRTESWSRKSTAPHSAGTSRSPRLSAAARPRLCPERRTLTFGWSSFSALDALSAGVLSATITRAQPTSADSTTCARRSSGWYAVTIAVIGPIGSVSRVSPGGTIGGSLRQVTKADAAEQAVARAAQQRGRVVGSGVLEGGGAPGPGGEEEHRLERPERVAAQVLAQQGRGAAGDPVEPPGGIVHDLHPQRAEPVRAPVAERVRQLEPLVLHDAQAGAAQPQAEVDVHEVDEEVLAEPADPLQRVAADQHPGGDHVGAVGDLRE